MHDLKLNSRSAISGRSSAKEEEEATPEQTPGQWLALLYFFWIGGVCLAPWSSIINSFDYFGAKFPNDNVSFVFPIGPYVANVILLSMITHVSKILSYKARIILGLVALMILECVIPFEAQALLDSEGGFWLIMLLLLLMGFFGNLIYASICGFASQVHTKFMVSFMLGVAGFGLIMNLTKEGTLLIYNTDDDGDIRSILVYFGLTLVFLVIGLILHFMFMRSRFYHVELKKIAGHYRTVTDSSYTSLMQPEQVRPKKNFKTLFSIFIEGWFPICLMFISMLQHGTCYPGVMLLKKMPSMADTTKTVSLVTTFNVFYIVGKLIGQFRNRYNIKVVVIVMLFRFVVDALFVLQVVEPNTPVWGSEWFAYVNVATAAVTLGFLVVALFIMIPEQFGSEKKELAGFVAVIGNNFGTMGGAFLALTLKNLSP